MQRRRRARNPVVIQPDYPKPKPLESLQRLSNSANSDWSSAAETILSSGLYSSYTKRQGSISLSSATYPQGSSNESSRLQSANEIPGTGFRLQRSTYSSIAQLIKEKKTTRPRADSAELLTGNIKSEATSSKLWLGRPIYTSTATNVACLLLACCFLLQRAFQA